MRQAAKLHGINGSCQWPSKVLQMSTPGIETTPSEPLAADAYAERVSAEQRAWKSFREQGINVKAWAADRGFNPGLVYSVLRGERKCLRGQSHDVAVALGLK